MRVILIALLVALLVLLGVIKQNTLLQALGMCAGDMNQCGE